MLRYDPKSVSFNKKVISSSGLNKTEIHRLLKKLFFNGYVNNEEFYQKLQCVLTDDPSGNHVHFKYEWKEIPSRDDDNNRFLKIKHMKKTD